jgi:hypothetical protein
MKLLTANCKSIRRRMSLQNACAIYFGLLNDTDKAAGNCRDKLLKMNQKGSERNRGSLF